MQQSKPISAKRCTALLNQVIGTIIQLQRTEDSVILKIEEMQSYRRSMVLEQTELSGDFFSYSYITLYPYPNTGEKYPTALHSFRFGS